MAKGDTPTVPSSAQRRRDDAPDVLAADRYVLVEQLGEGGMGVVWKARDRVLDRLVAFKVLHDEYLGAADQQRLATEARAMARLSHPNVVAVYDVGVREGRTYITMELVDGVSLSRWLATPRGWREVVAVFRHVGEGLAAAHDAGLIHRDIKPDNILVGEDGRIRVADFGVADAHALPAPVPEVGGAVTRTTGLVGSPAYMSPERLRGEPAGASGDQFGFAVALYEALHGRRPYDHPTIDGLRAAMEAGPPPPVRDVPRWLHEVVARGLAADPDARFASMRALLEALRGPRRRRGLLAAAALGGIAMTAGWVMLGDREASPCAGSQEHLAGVWDAPIQARLATAFDATGLGFAPATWGVTARILDRHAGQWVAMHEASCRATRVDRTQSVETLERRTLCLDRRRAGLLQVIDVLGAADPRVVEKAPEIARGLAPISECADPAYLAGLAGGGDGDAGARGDLPAARIALYSGDLAQGHARAERVIAAARAAGDRALEAEALVLRGTLEAQQRESATSADTLARAIELAGEIGASRVRIDGWIQLSATLQALGRLPEAGPLLDLADTALRAAPDPRREGMSANTRGTLLARQSHYDRAVVEFERALVRLREAYGPTSPSLAGTLKNLGQARRRLGQHAQAEQHLRDALALVEPLGADHPDTLSVRRARAVMLDTLGRSADALAELRTIHDARIRRSGPDHLDVAASHDDLAIALGKVGRHEESLVEHRAGLAIRERRLPGSREVLDSKAHVAETLTFLGKHAEAEAMLREMIADRTRMFGRAHVDVGVGYRQLGNALVMLERYDEAVAALREARAILTEVYGKEHRDVARIDRDEARAERRRGRRDRARALAERAVAGFGAARDIEAGLARWELAQALDPRTPRSRSLASEARDMLAGAQGAIAASAVTAIDAWLTRR